MGAIRSGSQFTSPRCRSRNFAPKGPEQTSPGQSGPSPVRAKQPWINPTRSVPVSPFRGWIVVPVSLSQGDATLCPGLICCCPVGAKQRAQLEVGGNYAWVSPCHRVTHIYLTGYPSDSADPKIEKRGQALLSTGRASTGDHSRAVPRPLASVPKVLTGNTICSGKLSQMDTQLSKYGSPYDQEKPKRNCLSLLIAPAASPRRGNNISAQGRGSIALG